MTMQLKSLSISNFRSIRGNIVVPLDASVVLIHATNGMGKTSILSALELGLTGRIAHLDERSQYQHFFTNVSSSSGNVVLSAQQTNTTITHGRVDFSPNSFVAAPLLHENNARFFSERCYLPQAVLGRLLDLYNEKKATESRLTQFVRELLKLDPLDAIIDGLYPAHHVTRIRKLLPELKSLEDYQKRTGQDLKAKNDAIAVSRTSILDRIRHINELIKELPGSNREVEFDFIPPELRSIDADQNADHDALTRIAVERANLSALDRQLMEASNSSADVDISAMAEKEQSAAVAYTEWLNVSGATIEALLQEFRSLSPPPTLATDGDIHNQVNEAIEWCMLEIVRCERLLEQSVTASKTLELARSKAQRAAARISEINASLASSSTDARTLANALAGIAPHVEDDICPVCSRDFRDLDQGSLTSHIAQSIARLTSEAGKLQALASERASESDALASARQDEIAAERL